MKKQKGLTMMEVLIVLVIVAILAAILTPVFSKIKRTLQIHSSEVSLKNLHLILSIYRQEYDGEGFIRYDLPNSYYGLGLPTSTTTWTSMGVKDEVFISPCGSDDQVHESWYHGTNGYIDYVAPVYEPIHVKPDLGNYKYRDYISNYQENIVIFVDPYCNPAGTSMTSLFLKKRGIAILLSGRIMNKYDYGNASCSNLEWYSFENE